MEIKLKEARIKEIWQVNVYCSECDTIMEYDGVEDLYGIATYFYSCPKCRNSQTSLFKFPKQKVVFYDDTVKELSEDEMHKIYGWR